MRVRGSSLNPSNAGNGPCMLPAGDRRPDYANVTVDRLW
jgi:hypothetical protein